MKEGYKNKTVRAAKKVEGALTLVRPTAEKYKCVSFILAYVVFDKSSAQKKIENVENKCKYYPSLAQSIWAIPQDFTSTACQLYEYFLFNSLSQGASIANLCFKCE